MAGESAESFNYNRLYKACYDGHLGVVQQVLDCTAPERLTALINQHNVNHLGFTPLHQAARQGHIAIVSYLIERGADCNARSGSGQTILHVACIAGHTTTAELLLTHGADIEEKYKDSETALYLACFSGRNATAEMLIASGADVRVKDKVRFATRKVWSDNRAVLELVQSCWTCRLCTAQQHCVFHPFDSSTATRHCM
eukprot:m.38861 g.38861  ORF g.38861 m.38861 type:complete len:198 (-) comp12621_c0_seq10:513-1106(-)